jgi:hypothetical protein
MGQAAGQPHPCGKDMPKLIDVGALLAAALLGSTAAAGEDCTVATKGDSPVAQACQKGGRAEAKKVMKGAVKAAKDKGKKFDCDDCHKDVANDKFDLKPDARDKFKQLLEAAGAK